MRRDHCVSCGSDDLVVSVEPAIGICDARTIVAHRGKPDVVLVLVTLTSGLTVLGRGELGVEPSRPLTRIGQDWLPLRSAHNPTAQTGLEVEEGPQFAPNRTATVRDTTPLRTERQGSRDRQLAQTGPGDPVDSGTCTSQDDRRHHGFDAPPSLAPLSPQEYRAALLATVCLDD